MRFWDTSAVIPLCMEERESASVEKLLRDDRDMVVWWGTIIECHSTLSSINRDNVLTKADANQVKELFKLLAKSWIEVEPTNQVRLNAERLLRLHPLRAADSLQLGAALVWAGGNPANLEFVCFDQRLSRAAELEGFAIKGINIK